MRAGQVFAVSFADRELLKATRIVNKTRPATAPIAICCRLRRLSPHHHRPNQTENRFHPSAATARSSLAAENPPFSAVARRLRRQREIVGALFVHDSAPFRPLGRTGAGSPLAPLGGSGENPACRRHHSTLCRSVGAHAVAGYRQSATTCRRTASGRVGHAATTAARSGSMGAESPESAPDLRRLGGQPPFFPRNSPPVRFPKGCL